MYREDGTIRDFYYEVKARPYLTGYIPVETTPVSTQGFTGKVTHDTKERERPAQMPIECPICHQTPEIQYACGDWFLYCSDHCLSPMCDHATPAQAISEWNRWCIWFRNYMGKVVTQE